MRRVCKSTAEARLLFVVDEHDEDSVHGDVLAFNVTRTDRSFGTYLLTNAFFRHILESPAYSRCKYIGRSDDDSAFHVQQTLATMQSLDMSLLSSSSSSIRGSGTSGESGRARHLVFGPMREWYMWNRHSMMPECWWPGPGLSIVVRNASGRFPSAAPTKFCAERLLTAQERGCTVVGPYPFAKGPLAVMSRELVRDVILPRLRADEEWALSAASAKLRSRRAIIFDDIYYGALIYSALRERPLTLVDAPLSEYQNVKIKPGRRRRRRPPPPALHARGQAIVYHKLKQPQRFQYVANRSLLEPLSGGTGGASRGTDWHAGRLECVSVPEEFSSPRRNGWFAEDVRSTGYHDCAQWRFCTYKGVAYPTPPYYRA